MGAVDTILETIVPAGQAAPRYPSYIESIFQTAGSARQTTKDGMIPITRAPRGAARLFLTAIASLLASSAPLHAQPAPALRLIPMPREVRAGDVLSLNHGVLVRTGSLDPEDRFTADDLRAAIEEH